MIPSSSLDQHELSCSSTKDDSLPTEIISDTAWSLPFSLFQPYISDNLRYVKYHDFLELHSTLTLSEMISFIVQTFNEELYGTVHYQSIAQSLNDSLGRGGACPNFWESRAIAFECGNCEKDEACAVCADCFFNSNHTGHTFRMIRTAGGCCDCGDICSWESTGNCLEHQGVTAIMDGEESLSFISNSIVERAKIMIPTIIELLTLEVKQYIGFETRPPTLPNSYILLKEEKAKRSMLPLLHWIQDISSIAFGFRFIVNNYVCKSLLEPMIGNLYFLPPQVQRQFHHFLLKLLVSPSFKKRFAPVLVKYHQEAIQYYYQIINLRPFKGEIPAFPGLAVQVFTIPELALECMLKWYILHHICKGLTCIITISEDTGTMTFPHDAYSLESYMWSVVLIDLRYLLRHKEIHEYFLMEQSNQPFEKNEIISEPDHSLCSLDLLLHLMLKLHEMNLQTRCTEEHINFENSAFGEVFSIESGMLDSFMSMIEYTQQDHSLEILMNFYKRLINMLHLIPNRDITRVNQMSFHCPLTRFIGSVINKFLLFKMMILPHHTVIEDAFLKQFDIVFALKLLEQSLVPLIMASEIDHGFWVRNGRVMKTQRICYRKSSFEEIDLNNVQLSIRILGYWNMIYSQLNEIPIDIHLNTNILLYLSHINYDDLLCLSPIQQIKQLGTADPFMILFGQVFKITGQLNDTLSLHTIWSIISQVIQQEGTVILDHETRLITDQFRIQFIFELLGRIMNEFYYMEAENILNNTIDNDELLVRKASLIRREIIQYLAVQEMNLSKLEFYLRKQWILHPQFEDILESVTEQQSKGNGPQQATTLLHLKLNAWKLYDMFWPLIPGDGVLSGEEEVLKYKTADLLGPTRIDAKMSPFFEFLQDSLIDSFKNSCLLSIIFKFFTFKASVLCDQKTIHTENDNQNDVHHRSDIHSKIRLWVYGGSNQIECIDLCSVFPNETFPIKRLSTGDIECEQQYLDQIYQIAETRSHQMLEQHSSDVCHTHLSTSYPILQQQDTTEFKTIFPAFISDQSKANKLSDNKLFKFRLIIGPENKKSNRLSNASCKKEPEILCSLFLKLLDVLHQGQVPCYPNSTSIHYSCHTINKLPSFSTFLLKKEFDFLSQLVMDLATISEFSTQPNVTHRVLKTCVVRLHDIYHWTRNHNVYQIPFPGFGNIVYNTMSNSTLYKPNTLHTSSMSHEMEEAKERQKKALERMKHQQQMFLQKNCLQSELNYKSSHSTSVPNSTEQEQNNGFPIQDQDSHDDIECAMCREPGTKTNPLGLAMTMTLSNIIRQTVVQGASAFPTIWPNITTCGHVAHLVCFEKHKAASQERRNNGGFYSINRKPNSFPCPVCRTSVIDVLPYLPVDWIVTSTNQQPIKELLQWKSLLSNSMYSPSDLPNLTSLNDSPAHHYIWELSTDSNEHSDLLLNQQHFTSPCKFTFFLFQDTIDQPLIQPTVRHESNRESFHIIESVVENLINDTETGFDSDLGDDIELLWATGSYHTYDYNEEDDTNFYDDDDDDDDPDNHQLHINPTMTTEMTNDEVVPISINTSIDVSETDLDQEIFENVRTENNLSNICSLSYLPNSSIHDILHSELTEEISPLRDSVSFPVTNDVSEQTPELLNLLPVSTHHSIQDDHRLDSNSSDNDSDNHNRPSHRKNSHLSFNLIKTRLIQLKKRCTAKWIDTYPRFIINDYETSINNSILSMNAIPAPNNLTNEDRCTSSALNKDIHKDTMESAVNVMIDPLSQNVIASTINPDDTWCFLMQQFFKSFPLSLRHSGVLRFGDTFNWPAYAELLLASSIKKTQITVEGTDSTIPLYSLLIRNAMISRDTTLLPKSHSIFNLTYWQQHIGLNKLLNKRHLETCHSTESFLTSPWSCDIRQEFLWNFLSGHMTSPDDIRKLTVELMAIRQIQILEDIIFDLITSDIQTHSNLNESKLKTNSSYVEPDALEELVNKWLENSPPGSFPIADLRASIEWGKYMTRDFIGSQRLLGHYPSIYSNENTHASTNTDVSSSSVLNIFLSNTMDTTQTVKNAEFYLDRIEKFILPIIINKFQHTGLSEHVIDTEESASKNKNYIELESLLVDAPLNLIRSNIQELTDSSTCSATSDAAQPQYQGPDKLRRFENQLIKLVSKKVPKTRGQNAATLSLLWTFILHCFPHYPRLVDIILPEDISGLLQQESDMITVPKLFLCLVQRCLSKQLGQDIDYSENNKHHDIIIKWWIMYQTRLIESLREFLVFVCWTISSIWTFSTRDRNRIAFPPDDTIRHYQGLCEILGIHPQFELNDLTLNRKTITLMWNQLFIKHLQVCRNLRIETKPPRFNSFENFQFAPLPNDYIEHVKQVYKRACPNCGNTPKEPAYCLTCGGIVCFESDCCEFIGRFDECNRHASRCGGGQGLFSLSYLSYILAIDSTVRHVFDSIYVDRHGNPHLGRGKQALLNHRRLEELRSMYITGELSRDMTASTQRTVRYRFRTTVF